MGKRPDDTDTSEGRKAGTVRPWTPDSPPVPTLLVLSGTPDVGRTFAIEGEEMLIGRSSEVDVWLDEGSISRQHAKVGVAGRTVTLSDLGSTNGTFCNGEPVTEERALQEGDKIQIGKSTILKFTWQDTLDEQMQRQLYESATRDGLTAVYNRKYFLEALGKEYAFSERHGAPLSLAVIDVDHFKQVNDTHGHLVGDAVLRTLAAAVGACVREEDLLARYGGEEFALVLRQCPHEEALLLSERIRRLVEGLTIDARGQQLKVTVSAGVATMKGQSHASPEALLEQADQQLYKAKQAGRNRVCPSPRPE